MSTETWHKGYQEVKNIIHNEMGITKEEILDIFRQIAKNEIQEILSEKKTFIHDAIREVIKQEMMDAVADHNYPKINKSMWNYTKDHSFRDFIVGVMKEEILDNMRQQFEITLDIEKKI